MVLLSKSSVHQQIHNHPLDKLVLVLFFSLRNLPTTLVHKSFLCEEICVAASSFLQIYRHPQSVTWLFDLRAGDLFLMKAQFSFEGGNHNWQKMERRLW